MSDKLDKLEKLLLIVRDSGALTKAATGDDEEENLDEMGFSEVDLNAENDEADKWLKENEPTGEANPEAKAEPQSEPQAKTSSKSGYVEWSPRQDYSAEEKGAMDKFVADGFTHREAERMANAHKSPKTFEEALKHRVHPSAPSQKMLDMIRPHAKEWHGRAMQQTDVTSDPERNPIKHAAGKAKVAREEHRGTYKKAYSDFLGSDNYKKLEGMERHQAIEKFKQDWHSSNPEYRDKLHTIMNPQEHKKTAMATRKTTLQEIMDHLVSGAQSSTGMSSQEAAQHVGGTKTEDEGHVASTFTDPAATFARQNPHFIEQLRMKRDQGTKPPVVPKVSPHISVVRTKANPDQLKRFETLHAKKGVKPEGVK